MSDKNGPWRGLYGHAMLMLPSQDAFVLYGGKNADENSSSSDLWLFNLTSHQWSLKAQLSAWKPPALSKHSLTLADDHLYVFGGSYSNGSFSNSMFRIDLDLKEWQIIKPKSGHALHVTGHSMVFYPELQSLILFGGIRRDVARFSQLSNLMFTFHLPSKTWTQLKLEMRAKHHHSSINYVPPERAFHSASIMGNYMVIFGGYSHKHNEVENCYDDALYFFHLGCFTWVNRRILEHSPQGRIQLI